MAAAQHEVVLIDAVRTPIGRARRGSLSSTLPDELLFTVLEALRRRNSLEPRQIGDLAVGNVSLSGSYALAARTAMLRAGYSHETPVYAVNRQCASGLQALANIAASIAAGEIEVGVAAGVESMSLSGGPADAELPPMSIEAVGAHPLAASCLTPMGITAENVASRYGISREQQDAMAVRSHAAALAAQASGAFDDELVPVAVPDGGEGAHGATRLVSKDDGPRTGTTMEVLARLRPVFQPEGGTVTAGTSSQVSDGAAAVLLMSRAKAVALGLRPLASLRSFRAVGVLPDEMGVGPAVAIPAALAAAGVSLEDVDVFEINEAFAAQAVYCARKLGIAEDKLNPLGGAIALGHPLGCTGARMVATLVHHMQRTKKRLGVVSLCIGTGMGAAAVFEAE